MHVSFIVKLGFMILSKHYKTKEESKHNTPPQHCPFSSRNKEVDEFNRSITSYVRKSKYDTNFYTNNSKYIHTIFDSGDFKEIFNSKKDAEKYISNLFIDSMSWRWFESIR